MYPYDDLPMGGNSQQPSFFGSLLGGLPGIGADVIGGILARKQQERQRRTQNDQLRLNAQDLALRAAEFNRGAPHARMQDALRGDVLAGVQPFQLAGEGRTLSGTGGLTPALISAGSRQLGQEVARRALLSEMGQPGAGGPRPVMPARPAAPASHGGIFGDLLARARAQQQMGQTEASLPFPDPYTFLPFGGRPQHGGPNSLWPEGSWE